jgi:hypothetical protein
MYLLFMIILKDTVFSITDFKIDWWMKPSKAESMDSTYWIAGIH